MFPNFYPSIRSFVLKEKVLNAKHVEDREMIQYIRKEMKKENSEEPWTRQVSKGTAGQVSARRQTWPIFVLHSRWSEAPKCLRRAELSPPSGGPYRVSPQRGVSLGSLLSTRRNARQRENGKHRPRSMIAFA